MNRLIQRKGILIVLAVLLVMQMNTGRIAAKEKNSVSCYAGTIVVDQGKGEMLMCGSNRMISQKYLDEEIQKYKGKCKLNQAEALKTIRPGSMNQLVVAVSSYGAVIEPTLGNQIVISYVGADDKANVEVNISEEKQKLTVSIKGNGKHTLYINPSEKERANTIKIGVPKKLFDEITIKGKTGSVLLSKTEAALFGGTESGIIIVKEDTGAKNITLDSINGTLYVEGNQLTEETSLKTINGAVHVKAERITGNVFLNAVNGTTRLEAGTVMGTTILKAINGTVVANVDKLTGDTQASVENGVLKFKLTRKPENLKLKLLGIKKNKLPYGWKLPSGWEKGKTVGNGKPVLALKAASNGVLHFKIEK